WRHPVDIPSLLNDVFGELDSLVERVRQNTKHDWAGHAELAETILDGEPEDVVEALRSLLAEGVPLEKLASAVAYAASRRLVHFHVSNEFGDWDTVHHTFTYTNAVDQAMRRAPTALLARGI